jgi:trehalose 6-phosphate phosphatase
LLLSVSQELAAGATPTAAPLAPPTALPLDQCALFLDLDGTLIEYAHHPRAVTVDAPLLSLLQLLPQHLGGAVALVSGRSIEALDQLLDPLRLPASGLHGFERRSARGVHSRHAAPLPQALATARRLLAQLAARDPRIRLEDKGFALALHFRQAPELEPELIDAARLIAAQIGGGLELLLGPKVAELTPQGVSKASAVAEFMREPPFSGRRPLFVGDDPTDEPAFEWVNAAGGLSVAVNVTGATTAATRLRSVREVRAWLHALLGSSA